MGFLPDIGREQVVERSKWAKVQQNRADIMGSQEIREKWSLTSLCNLKIQCHLAAFSQPSLLNRPSANPRLGVATTLLKLRKGPPDQCFVLKIHFLLGNKKMKAT